MATATQKTLVGWKAIAGYFSRDERTVMRWAASRGMPVQRVAGQARSSVYAWPEDLDAWLGRPRTAPLPGPQPVALPVADTPVAIAPAEPASPSVWPGRSGRRGSREMRLALAAAGLLLAVAAFWWLTRDRAALPPTAIRSGVAVPAFHDGRARAAFLQAQFDWNLRTRESLTRAITEFGEAVTRDPGVAASYVGIANSYLLLREYGALPDAEAYARASAAAKVAITLDPRSMEARRSLAFVAFWGHGDVAAAARHFAEALALAPGDPLTHHWLATSLAANGEAAAALREIASARTLDPTSSSILVDYGVIAYLAGRRAESGRILTALLRSDPQDASLHHEVADIALFEGRYRDYLAEAARSAELRSDSQAQRTVAGETTDFARGGGPLMLEHMVDAARDRTRRSNDGFFDLARVAAVSGRTVAAIDALAPACNRREPGAIGAPGDLWLSRAVAIDTVRRLCGRPSLDGIIAAAWRPA